jgi:N6-adenosine-specific RNA methylase IME4
LNPPYRTIVADPPWRYDIARIVTTGKQRRAEAMAHYSTLYPTEVAMLPVGDLAANDAHLYLWVTNPMLPQAFDVLPCWGFRYVTTLTWVKTGTLGMGFHFRGDTEHVLFGVRGDLPIPPEKRERNVFTAARCGHSVKPGAFFDLVERVSPGPYVELFARQPRLGWDSWGYGYESRTA